MEIDIKENNHNLLNEIVFLIETSKRETYHYLNSTLTLLFWKVGNRINKEILDNKRAIYGKQIVSTISIQLEQAYGRNFNEKNVRRMMQFSEKFDDFEIVVTLSRHLSWSHFLVLIPLKNIEARLFYSKISQENNLGVRELRNQIIRKAYERAELANSKTVKPELLNTFKDPYILDFLGLKNTFLEKDLESAILKELESFILELGNGFAFIERQKRMVIDGEDFHLDLLFFNRKLKRLVAVELKLGKFEAAHKGQMELYLRWLDKYERQLDENQPIGLILCAESSSEQIELLEMNKDRIMVAEYWTELPPRKQFEQKIHSLILEARERLEKNNLLD